MCQKAAAVGLNEVDATEAEASSRGQKNGLEYGWSGGGTYFAAKCCQLLGAKEEITITILMVVVTVVVHGVGDGIDQMCGVAVMGAIVALARVTFMAQRRLWKEWRNPTLGWVCTGGADPGNLTHARVGAADPVNTKFFWVQLGSGLWGCRSWCSTGAWGTKSRVYVCSKYRGNS